MTALASAIINTPSLDALRLRGRAYEMLIASEVDPRKAVGSFLAAVRSDRALLFELLGYAAVRDRALAYLEAAAADMRHETEGEPARPDDERHCISRSSPSSPNSDGDDALSNDERQGATGSSPSEPEEAQCSHERQAALRSLPSGGDDARLVSERQESFRSSTFEGEEAQTNSELRDDARSSPSGGDDAHSMRERHSSSRLSPPETPVLIPLPKRGPAELEKIKAHAPRSAFDSILLRDSRPIGDLQWSAIDRFISANSYETALLRQVKAYNPPADPNELIRYVVPLDEFNRMAQRAAEESAQ